MKKFLLALVCTMLIFPGCFVQQYPADSTELEYKTVWGLAEDTKDGYYINAGYILQEEEIIKYKPDYKSGDYSGKHLVINAKVRTENIEDCTSPTGEVVQCRKGKSSYLYDIKSLEEKEI